MTLIVYPLKNALMTPVVAWRRRKFRDLDPAFRRAFERNRYAPGFTAYVGHVAFVPNLMVDVGLGPDDIAFDVGSYDGSWSVNLAKEAGPTIHAFEPAPHPYDLTCRAVADLDRVHVHAYGLGGRDEAAELGLSAAGSSLHSPGTMGTTSVSIRDVVGVLDELGIERLGLLKLNIEGAEYDLLDRLIDTGRLADVDRILVQFHEFVPHAHRRRWQARRALRRDHEEVWSHPWVWEYWRRPGL